MKYFLIISLFFSNINFYNNQASYQIIRNVNAEESDPVSLKIIEFGLDAINAVGKIVEFAFVDVMKCDELDFQTFSVIFGDAIPLPSAFKTIQYISPESTVAGSIEGFMHGFGTSKKSICAKNALVSKGLFTTFTVGKKGLSFIKEPTAKLIAEGIVYGFLIAFFAYLITMYTSARILASDAQICLNNDNHPFGYSKEQIKSLLIDSNEEPTIENIVNKKNKLCVKYNNSIAWLKDQECHCFSDTQCVCARNLTGYSHILCGFTPSACPCLMNINNGREKGPEIKRDVNGNIELDSAGNPIFDQNDYQDLKDKYMKHCRIILPDDYIYYNKDEVSGIIDDSCYNLRGYSKRHLSITAGIAQCFTNTARNIFEKPIFYISKSFKNNNYKKNQNYIYDISLVDQYINKILENNIEEDLKYSQLSTEKKNILNQNILNILNSKVKATCFKCESNDASFETTFAEKYNTINCSATVAACDTNSNSRVRSLSFDNYLGQEENNRLIDKIKNINQNDYPIEILRNIKAEIQNKLNQEELIYDLYSYDESQTGRENNIKFKMTMFDQFNNQIKFFAILIIMFWFFILGYKILTGEISLGLDSLKELSINLFISWFFIFTDFWKEWLFKTMIILFQSIGILLSDIATIFSPYKDNFCRYGLTKTQPVNYTEDKNILNSSNFQGLYCQTDYRLDCYKYNANGKCITGECLSSKPLIPNLEYERPYIVVEYYSNQLQKWQNVPMHCVDGSNPIKIFNTKINKFTWLCTSAGLEDGYRTEDLRQIFDIDINYQNPTIETAFKNINTDGSISDTYPIKTQNQNEIQNRVARIQALEEKRQEINIKTEYGKYKVYGNIERSTDYIKFFDFMDCKIMRILFLGFGFNNSDIDLLNMDISEGGASIFGGIFNVLKFVLFTFPFGLISAILMIFIAISLFLVLFRCLQSYVIGMFGLVCYAYLSPIFFLLRLFKSTEGAFNNWLENMKKYMILPSLSFLSLGIYMSVMEFAIFGDPNQYHELFTLSGTISDTCYSSDPGSAPVSCIIHKIVKDIDFDSMFSRLLLMIALGVAGGGILGSAGLGAKIGLGAGMLLIGTDNIVSARDLFVPFIFKLSIAVVIVLIGVILLDKIEQTVGTAVGIKDDGSMKLGTIFEQTPFEVIKSIKG